MPGPQIAKITKLNYHSFHIFCQQPTRILPKISFMLASFLKSNLLRTHLCENVKGRLVTSNQRLYGNAQNSPGVLKRTQNKETWGKGTCCLCTFYQSDRSGWWISLPISSQKNICLKPLWLNIWIWESNFVRLFVLIAINAAARKLSWQFHFWWNIDVQGQIWAKI